jgi:hypothetical protein
MCPINAQVSNRKCRKRNLIRQMLQVTAGWSTFASNIFIVRYKTPIYDE